MSGPPPMPPFPDGEWVEVDLTTEEGSLVWALMLAEEFCGEQGMTEERIRDGLQLVEHAVREHYVRKLLEMPAGRVTH